MVKLVIVESPAKCKKIAGYLGSGYKCIASFGHIYQLSGVNKAENFKPEFKLIPVKNKYIKQLRQNIRQADEIILATDDDREGEAIAWHICRLAKLPINTTKRIIFHEITKPALKQAITNPTTINMLKVQAQLGRQILDRLVGFTISPVLWKQFFYKGRNKSGLSAGRCQTPALRLVYDNQIDIDNEAGKKIFDTVGYFTDKNLPYKLNYSFEQNNRVEDFLIESVNFDHVLQVCNSPTIRIKQAPLPFSTSSLQQVASNVLHFSPKRTMQVAQKLYEGGYITYMRTDNKKYSAEFINTAIPFIKSEWSVGDDYIKSKTKLNAIMITSKSKKQAKQTNATQKTGGKPSTQEAHEAIRPTNITTKQVPLGSLEQRLYQLIWNNTVESCMSDAKLNVIKSVITAPFDYAYEYTTEQVVFLGWLIVRNSSTRNEIYNFLANVKKQSIEYKKINSNQTIKKLKSHLTEARLIQQLEKKGIGRPSTFSSLVSKIQERGYVKKQDVEGTNIMCTEYQLIDDELEETEKSKMFGNEKNKLVLQPLGREIISFLIDKFNPLFVYKYTSDMETNLDKISQGKLKWERLCMDCNTKMNELIQNVVTKKNLNRFKIDENHTYMVSKYGPVIKFDKDGKTKFLSIRKDIELDLEKLHQGGYQISEIIATKSQYSGNVLGTHNGQDVVLKKGRYGLYITYNGKNYSLKGVQKDENDIKLEDVIDIINGKRSNTNIILTINDTLSVRNGKYGPYVYYKTSKMTKPRFFNFNQMFKRRLSKDAVMDIVENDVESIIQAVSESL